MVDLFRYIEQSFVVPPANPDAIDVSDASDFQKKLLADTQLKEGSPQALRKEAEKFINNATATDPVIWRQQYLDLHDRLLHATDTGAVKNTIETIFDSPVERLVAADTFKKDKRLLNDLLIAVKMVTGFDKVRAKDLVTMRQAIAFVEAVNAYPIASPEAITATLLRPVVIPSAFLKPPVQPPPVEPPPAGDTEEVKKRKALQKEYDSLKAAYTTLMSLRPDELEMKDLQPAQKPVAAAAKSRGQTTQLNIPVQAFSKQALTLNAAAIRKLEPPVMQMLEREGIDIKTADYADLVTTTKSRASLINLQLNPCGRVKEVTKVYRLGINAFAVKTTETALTVPAPSPDFSHAVTRPVGIGNLQVVRQELLGYEASEVSHIENILEGEVLRHFTKRSETNELTITDETQTTQTDERDLQSTVRNEMVSETQKEAGQQSASTQDQTTTTSYGKLVENSKSNYAKTVTDRAVSSLSQQVRHQRIQREKKTFIEKTVHEFDNSQQGAKNVTGIYQWVDKKYKTRIMNYGMRLLYDVVVPEPAAFLIESLKNAPQPEGLELIKPDVFDMCPSCLDADNYLCLAAKYGATAAVTPPPDDFLLTISHTDSSMSGPTKVNGLGSFFKDFVITIKENYKAIKTYVKMVPPNDFVGGRFDLTIGEHYRILEDAAAFYTIPAFQMNNETGDIPVTFRSWNNVYQYSFAIGIYCQRTDKAMEQWQLKTHAALLNGYNRQLAEYQDKLSKLQAVIRAQMAQASNYAHNPSIEQGELKKAFIYLLLGEHFNQAYIPAPNPLLTPPNPVYIKKWGAMVAFFERAFEWENIMFTYYPYFWSQPARWGELILIQDLSPEFEEFLKAGAARVVVPVRPGFEAALAHYQETGDVWMGEEIPDMFSDLYVTIIQEIKARNFAPGDEKCVAEWDVKLPTTLVMLKENATLPEWKTTVNCKPA